MLMADDNREDIVTPRPSPVTVARTLLLVVAVLPLLSALLGLVVLDELRRAYIASLGGVRGADEATGAVIGGVLACVVVLVVYAVPALLLSRPRNWVRIVVWVLTPVGVGCLAPGVLGGSSVSLPRGISPGGSSSEVTTMIGELTPGWYVPVTIVLAALSVVGLVLVAVLLALPASNAYFRTARPPVRERHAERQPQGHR